ncbi:MAG: helicase C-terminal domain-containing protein, partial [Actinomycetota bacterium]|nr:helicase C-terminal domain-containing protein [Actinomycetota bacterium]
TKMIPSAYLDAGGLDHAYAMTIHKAQGQTCDYAYVLGDEHLYREAGYSALTRGRHENHLYTAQTELDAEAHSDPEPEDGYATVIRSLDRSRQQELAIHQVLERELGMPRRSAGIEHDLDAGMEW